MKVFDALVEREAADPHVIGRSAACRENVHRFAHGRIAATDGDNAERGRSAARSIIRSGHEFRSGLVLLQQAVDHFLILVRSFGVAAELVVPGAAREERALGMDARQRSRRDEVLVFGVIALELCDLSRVPPRSARARGRDDSYRPK